MKQKKWMIIFDLDDTLYKEIDFLKSAYREISKKVESETTLRGIYKKMMQNYQAGKDVFQNLVNRSSEAISKENLLEMYRKHIPDIHLKEDTRTCLDALYKAGIPMGIITDGRSYTQRNKIRALGLEQWIPEENWIISEEIGSEKPDQKNYLVIEEKYPGYHYVYVGNNPKKDFKGANELGWLTVCLLDSGDEIHPQNFDLEDIYLPKIKVNSLKNILEKI